MKLEIWKLILRLTTATKEDYNYCHSLTKQNMSYYINKYYWWWKPSIFRNSFNPNNILIIKLNDKRIRYIQFRIDEDSFYLENIQISWNIRWKWIGSYLMEFIEKLTLENHKSIIKLLVFKDNPAVKLYERMSYKIEEDKWNVLLMRKDLI